MVSVWLHESSLGHVTWLLPGRWEMTALVLLTHASFSILLLKGLFNVVFVLLLTI